MAIIHEPQRPVSMENRFTNFKMLHSFSKHSTACNAISPISEPPKIPCVNHEHNLLLRVFHGNGTIILSQSDAYAVSFIRLDLFY